MQDLSLHILDVAENSVEAQAHTIEIRLEETQSEDQLVLEIIDDGKGMNEELRKQALDPFVTTKTTRQVGLGLPLLANGCLTIESEPDMGTRIRATFELSHIDRKPLGDIAQTLVTLIIGHPEVDIVYTHTINNDEYRLDTREIKGQLGGIPIHSPEVAKILKTNISEGLDQLRRKNEPRKSL
jgi:hypothetical protein